MKRADIPTPILCPICRSSVELLHRHLTDDRYHATGQYAIYRCSRCDHAFTWPPLSHQEIPRLYQDNYPLSKLTHLQVKAIVAKSRTGFRAWLIGDRHQAHKYLVNGETVLDIGCGSGASLLEAKALGFKAEGVEPDPNSQSLALKLNLLVHPGFITTLARSKKYDNITASQVLEHEPDPSEFLHAAYHHLKPGGSLILSFPNYRSVYRQLWGRHWLHWHVPYHQHFFSTKSITKLAKRNHLEVCRIFTVTPDLWTHLQLQALKKLYTRHSDHTPDTPVASLHAPDHPTKSIYALLTRFLLPTLITITNRMLDSLNLGESFVVILKKSK